MWNWLNTPRSLKFWLLLGGAVVIVPFEVAAVRANFETPHHSLALVYTVGLSALEAVLIWRAARAYRQ